MKARRTVGPTVATVVLALAVGSGAAAQPPGAGKPRERIVELAHQVTALAAIDTLPKQLKAFYKAHRQEMPSLALEPEFPVRGPEQRFMVDRLLPFPFRELPRSEAEVKAKLRGRRPTASGGCPGSSRSPTPGWWRT